MNDHPIDLALGTVVREDDHLAILVLHVAVLRLYAKPIQNCPRQQITLIQCCSPLHPKSLCLAHVAETE